MAAASTRMGGSRSPPFIIIGLSIAFCILGFNYWSLSSENSTLVEEFKASKSMQVVAEKRTETLVEEFKASKSKQVVAEKRTESVAAQYEQCKSNANAKDDDNKAANADKDAKIEAAINGEAACKKSLETAESNMVGVQTELQQVKGELTAVQEKVQACLTKECESLRKEIVTNFLDIVEKTLGKDTVDTLAKAGLTSDNNQAKQNPPAVQDEAAAQNPPVAAGQNQAAAQNQPVAAGQEQPPVGDKPSIEDVINDNEEELPQWPTYNRQLDVKGDDNGIEMMQQSLQKDPV